MSSNSSLRKQFSHVKDIVPTILEAAGIEAPNVVDGLNQLPIDGTSLLYSFADANAPEHRTTQYFEVFGNRAIYHEGWMASAFHGRLPWTAGLSTPTGAFEDDHWELYDLSKDFSQSQKLAAEMQENLRQQQKLFDQEAARVGILPLRDAYSTKTHMPNLTGGRTVFTYYPRAVSIPEAEAPKMVNRSWELTAQLQTPDSGAHGVIATIGGNGAGWSLFLDQSGTPVFEYRLFKVTRQTLKGLAPLSPGVHTLQVNFDYDGDGYAKGGLPSLLVYRTIQGETRLPASPPTFFSINETFDIRIDTGSPAGDYPQGAPVGYPLQDTVLKQVTLELR